MIIVFNLLTLKLYWCRVLPDANHPIVQSGSWTKSPPRTRKNFIPSWKKISSKREVELAFNPKIHHWWQKTTCWRKKWEIMLIYNVNLRWKIVNSEGKINFFGKRIIFLHPLNRIGFRDSWCWRTLKCRKSETIW